MYGKGIILSPALPYPPRKKQLSLFGGSNICGICKNTARLHTSTYLQAIGLIPILQTLIGRHRNALNYLQSR